MRQLGYGRVYLVVAAACALMLSACTTVCQPSETPYVVNTTEEEVSSVEYCTPGGPCTLRAAINTANLCRGGGPTTVQLQAGQTYVLTRPDSPPDGLRVSISERMEEEMGPVALSRILGTLTIEGQGATIARSEMAPWDFRLIHVTKEGNLTLRNVTLSGGYAHAGIALVSPRTQGGAIYNEGSVTLENSTLTGNIAHGRLGRARGGAIYNAGYLDITGGSLTANNAAEGAALYNATPVTKTITDTVTGMTSIVTETVTAAVRQVEVSGNLTGTVVFNDAYAELEMTEVMFAGNGNRLSPGEVLENWGILHIDQSTFHNNRGRFAGSIFLSGQLTDPSRTTIRRSTIVANTGRFGGGLFCSGPADLALIDVTIFQNNGEYIGGYSEGSPECDAILSNTIISANMPNNCGFNCGANGYCYPGDQLPTLFGANLSSDRSCNGFSIPDTPLRLGALGDNGGATPTLLPASDSPVINAGGSTCLETDQRGRSRREDEGCDIGAVERQADDR